MSELILVTLPIGNSADITQRALKTLKDSTIIYAEDTRVLKDTLKIYGIEYSQKFIDSFHDQSLGKIEQIIQKLENNESVVIVSDAGSPIISDPAFPLVNEVLKNGFQLKTVPGVTAIITALELSGLPPHPFHFLGFLGRNRNEKIESFNHSKKIAGTHIFYEAPHRIYETIEVFFETFSDYPDQVLVLGRELTKTYETVYRLTKDDLVDLKNIVLDKGEFVVLFHISQKQKLDLIDSELINNVNDYIENGGSPKKLAKIFAKILNSETKDIYGRLAKSTK